MTTPLKITKNASKIRGKEENYGSNTTFYDFLDKVELSLVKLDQLQLFYNARYF